MYAKVLSVGNDYPELFGAKDGWGGGYLLQQNPSEFTDLVLYLKERGPFPLYMEIGSASGGNLRFISEQVGFEKAFVIDDCEHPHSVHQEENYQNFNHTLARFKGDSHSFACIQFLRTHAPNEKFNCVFIDGDHSYSGVKQDVSLLLPYIDQNTLLIFHDIVSIPELGQTLKDMVDAGLLKIEKRFIDQDHPIGIAVCKLGDIS